MKEPCLVYSFVNSNSDGDFELEMAKNTPCQVHAFHCDSGLPKGLTHEKITGHQKCLSSQSLFSSPQYLTIPTIRKSLNHDQIHILKVDLKGTEAFAFKDWLPTDKFLPYQLIVQVHLTTFTTEETLLIFNQLFHLGYRITNRNYSKKDVNSMEFTLLRVRCI